MARSAVVLVVGTTADYIDWIERRSKRRALFLTSPRERERAGTRYAAPRREILADPDQRDACLQAVRGYIQEHDMPIAGLACFDDESLVLAAFLAQHLALRFPSAEAVRRCLDKFIAKRVWEDRGVPCPVAVAVTADFTKPEAPSLSFPCVVKPHCGSGSEHVYICKSASQVRRAAAKVIASPGRHAAHTTAVGEAFIEGHEFSCDFVVRDGKVRILRTAAKCMDDKDPPGTALAYILPAPLSALIRTSALPATLLKAARSLGIDHAICMVDFIVRDGEIFLLELSPRMGGDCLPHILFDGWGIDTLAAAMDFARGAPVMSWLKSTAPAVVGLRVFSPRAGTVATVATGALDDDPRVISHTLADCRGRVVVLPPADYASRLLGHVIFQPFASQGVEEQIHAIRRSITIEFAGAPS